MSLTLSLVLGLTSAIVVVSGSIVSSSTPLLRVDLGLDSGAAVILGSTKRLSCELDGADPSAKLVWYRDGVKVDGSFAHGESLTGQPVVVNDMQFRVVTSDIGATYECQTTISNQVHAARVQLDIVGPPLVDGYEPGSLLQAGDMLNLTCHSISGGPGSTGPTSVSWYRNGEALRATTHRTATKPPRIVSVLNTIVDAEAARTPYTCVVSNPSLHRNLEADVNLLVDVSLLADVTAATRSTMTTTAEPCKVSPLIDFVFILDSSSSIKPPDFKRQKQFLRDFVGQFDVEPQTGTQFGAVQFGTREKLEFHLNQYGAKTQVLAAIDGIRQTGVETYLDRGLRFFREQMRRPANGARQAARSLGIIITDGDATDKDAAHSEARLLRNSGAELWAIGVGEVKQSELLAITGNPARTFFTASYEALDGIVGQFVEAAKKQCDVTTSPPPTQAPPRPPGPPLLLEYKIGDPVILSESYAIECKSPGGDEMTEVVWYKDDVPVDRTHRHEDDGSYNHHRLRIDTDDATARYACIVYHPLLSTPLNLSFVFPIIGKPKIVGYEKGRLLRVGSVVTFSCFSVSTASNVELSWQKNGVPIFPTAPAEATPQAIISQLEIVVTPEDDLNEYTCTVIHPALADPLTDSVHLTVVPVPTVPPPGHPEVFATPPNWSYVGGKVNMTCHSMGNDPETKITWLRNGRVVDESFEIAGDRVTNVYQFTARAEDIGAVYDCLLENRRVNVTTLVNLPYIIKHRPPGPPVITGYGGSPLEPDASVFLRCRSTTARPDSQLLWYRDGVLLPSSTTMDVAGDAVESVLQLSESGNVADGAVYTCQLVVRENPDLRAPPPDSGLRANVTLLVMVHGGWSSWHSSVACTVTCGSGGTEIYIRHCDNPRPKNGGRPCSGPSSERRPCGLLTECPTVPTTTTTVAPTSQPEPPKGCDLLRGPMDIVLAVDGSDSIYEQNFALIAKFLSQLVTNFNVSSHHRVGAVLFGRSQKILFALGQHTNLASLQGALLSMRQRAVRGDATDTAGALSYVRHVAFGAAVTHENVPKVTIVVTDGRSQDQEATAAQARLIRASGILPIVVGIAVRAEDRQELLDIAGSRTRVLQARNYDALSLLAKELPTALSDCKMPLEEPGDEDEDGGDSSCDDPVDRIRPICPASCRSSGSGRGRCGERDDYRRSPCRSPPRHDYCHYACGRNQADEYEGPRDSAPGSLSCRGSCFTVNLHVANNRDTPTPGIARLMKDVVTAVSRCSRRGVRIRSRTSLTLAESDCDGRLCSLIRSNWTLPPAADGGGDSRRSPSDVGRVLHRTSEENGPIWVTGDLDEDIGCCRKSVVLLFLDGATTLEDVGRSAEIEARALRSYGADVLIVGPALSAEVVAAARRLVSAPSSDSYWYLPDEIGNHRPIAGEIAQRVCRDKDFHMK